MQSHRWFWNIVTLVLLSLIVSSVSAAPIVVNDVAGDIAAPHRLGPISSSDLKRFNSMLKSFGSNEFQQLPHDTTDGIRVVSGAVRWDVSLEELEANPSEYPDGYYGVSIDQEDHSAIIARITTSESIDDTTSESIDDTPIRLVNFYFTDLGNVATNVNVATLTPLEIIFLLFFIIPYLFQFCDSNINGYSD